MKERFKIYKRYDDYKNASYGKPEKQKQLVEDFHIDLKKLENTDIKDAVYKMYEKYGDRTIESNKRVKESIDFMKLEFNSILNQKEPKALYTCDLSGKTHDALRMFYNWIVNEVLFIEYEGYLVMLTFGVDD